MEMDFEAGGVSSRMAGGDAHDVRGRRPQVKMEADDEVEELTPTATPTHREEGNSDDDFQVIGSNFRGSRPVNKTRAPVFGEPEFIDLTKDEIEHEDDDEDEFEEDEDEEMSSDLIGANFDDSEVQEVPIDDMPELLEVEPVSKKELAEDRKKQGNDHFKRGEYNQAIQFYDKAIEYNPTESAYYGNRSAAYMMLKKYQEALSDTRLAIQYDPTYQKGYIRQIRITLALGDVASCEKAIEKTMELILPSQNKAEIMEESAKLIKLKTYLQDIETSKGRKDFRRVIFLCDRAMEFAIADLKLKIEKAEALCKLDRFNDAGELCTEILQSNLHCVEAIIIRSMCHYQSDNMEKSIQFLRQGLQFAPDNNICVGLYRKYKLMKEDRDKAATLYKVDKFTDAKAMYLKLIDIVKSGEMKNSIIESKLQFNLALLAQKVKNFDESIAYANKAIDINPSYFKAFVHRANVYSSKEMYDEAVRDFDSALKLEPGNKSLKAEIAQIKVLAKRAKRKDYYKILGVERNASEDDIRKAYKKRALLHHPDRHATATEELQKQQEKQFKDIGEAYEVLSDKTKRNRYDNGMDVSGGDSGSGCAYDPYDHTQIFNMFFNGGPGMAGTSRPGGGARYYTQSQYGSRPGGGGSYGFNR